MGTVGDGLSLPSDVSMYGITHTNTEIPGYKTKALLQKPATLPSYHGIPPHWLEQTGFDWAQALNLFKRPSPWASTPPPLPSIPPSQSRAPRHLDQGGASQPSNAAADPARDSPQQGASPPLSTHGITPSPDLEEEEGIRHSAPSLPPPSPIRDDGVSIGTLSSTWGRSLRRSIRLVVGGGKC